MNLTQSSPHGLAIIGLLDVLVSARTSRDGASLLRVVHKVEKGGEGSNTLLLHLPYVLLWCSFVSRL